MEEERGLGNVIFYIIAAIIAIISSIKGKKKPGQGIPGGPIPGEPARGGFPDDMFDEETDEFPLPEEYEGQPYKPEPVMQKQRQSVASMTPEMEGAYHEPMANSFSGEGVSALTFIETEKRFEELLKETATFDYDWDKTDVQEQTEDADMDVLSDEFDGRKAVIYSEILTRREY
ncbi:MAG: hypothetical protein IH591_09800 [Bacteroidales bacterium]|nr:hypothetical protein [Bacteroidales bacterium]